MAIPVWQAVDGRIFYSEDEAISHDLVCKITVMLRDAYHTHGGVGGGFEGWEEEKAKAVVDILVNTDVFTRLIPLMTE